MFQLSATFKLLAFMHHDFTNLEILLFVIISQFQRVVFRVGFPSKILTSAPKAYLTESTLLNNFKIVGDKFRVSRDFIQNLSEYCNADIITDLEGTWQPITLFDLEVLIEMFS